MDRYSRAVAIGRSEGGLTKDGQETEGSCNESGVFLWEVGFCYGGRENICEHLTSAHYVLGFYYYFYYYYY